MSERLAELQRELDNAEDERDKALARIVRLELERDILKGRVQLLSERLADEGRMLLELTKRS